MDEAGVGDEWNSGELIVVTLVDNDANKNSLADEDLDLNSNATAIMPAITIGSPITLASITNASFANNDGNHAGLVDSWNALDVFSGILKLLMKTMLH